MTIKDKIIKAEQEFFLNEVIDARFLILTPDALAMLQEELEENLEDYNSVKYDEDFIQKYYTPTSYLGLKIAVTEDNIEDLFIIV